ncbi:MAG: hypothetical protein C7B47_16700 [Sulfobacillus thermosulfidooxidans]|uniref:HTH gntR-type domain-containing protein n=1 Tax=Sulfobacillus thermosulfidooxidans TaxID=28034 RepID=A0A2T2WJI1_SULTH|nr:MAG: hypothetical protein C7B47_16700 [Sulfobacillus thermosulfidooxidans]
MGGRVWEDVVDVLRGEILSGKWAPDTVLPSRNELAQRFGVSTSAISLAYKQLIAEGLIYTPHGPRERRVVPSLGRVSNRDTEFLRDPAWQHPNIRTIRIEAVRPPEEVKALMPGSDRLIRWQSQHRDARTIVSLVEGWYYPATWLWDYVVKPDETFYAKLSAQHGEPIAYFEEWVQSRVTTPDERRQFETAGQSVLPILDIRRVTRTTSDKVVEVVHLLDLGTRYRLYYRVPYRSES